MEKSKSKCLWFYLRRLFLYILESETNREACIYLAVRVLLSTVCWKLLESKIIKWKSEMILQTQNDGVTDPHPHIVKYRQNVAAILNQSSI